MKAKLLLADAAVNHPDGTFSQLRGGIERIYVAPNKPPFLKAALIARIEATVGEKGKHSFRLVCIDEDGSSVLPDLEGNFEERVVTHISFLTFKVFSQGLEDTRLLSLWTGTNWTDGTYNSSGRRKENEKQEQVKQSSRHRFNGGYHERSESKIHAAGR